MAVAPGLGGLTPKAALPAGSFSDRINRVVTIDPLTGPGGGVLVGFRWCQSQRVGLRVCMCCAGVQHVRGLCPVDVPRFLYAMSPAAAGGSAPQGTRAGGVLSTQQPPADAHVLSCSLPLLAFDDDVCFAVLLSRPAARPDQLTNQLQGVTAQRARTGRPRCWRRLAAPRPTWQPGRACRQRACPWRVPAPRGTGKGGYECSVPRWRLAREQEGGGGPVCSGRKGKGTGCPSAFAAAAAVVQSGKRDGAGG